MFDKVRGGNSGLATDIFGKDLRVFFKRLPLGPLLRAVRRVYALPGEFCPESLDPLTGVATGVVDTDRRFDSDTDLRLSAFFGDCSSGLSSANGAIFETSSGQPVGLCETDGILTGIGGASRLAPRFSSTFLPFIPPTSVASEQAESLRSSVLVSASFNFSLLVRKLVSSGASVSPVLPSMSAL